MKYVDEEGVVSFPNEVGKCDHEISCGYHYTPRDFFRDNPNANIKEERSSDYVQPVKSTHWENLNSLFINIFHKTSRSLTTRASKLASKTILLQMKSILAHG